MRDLRNKDRLPCGAGHAYAQARSCGIAAQLNHEVFAMESLGVDEIVRRLLESVPPGLRSMQKDLENNFRAVLRASLSKLDLVSRDEFDAQVRVLERTRARLEELEKRLAELDRRP